MATQPSKSKPAKPLGKCLEHDWQDVREGDKKFVQCAKCGKFYGFYEKLTSESCLKVIQR